MTDKEFGKGDKNLLGLFVPCIIWAAIYMSFSYINVGKTPYLVRAIVVTVITIMFSLFLMGIISKYISEILGRPPVGKNYEEKLMES